MSLKRLRIGFLLLLGVTLLSANLGYRHAAAQQPQSLDSIPGTEVVLRADPTYNPWKVGPPVEFLAQSSADQAFAATLVRVNFNPSTCQGTVAAWPAQAQAVINRASQIWLSQLEMRQLVVIDACWRTDLDPRFLGTAGPMIFWRNFTNRPVADTWYPVALANQLAMSDLNGAQAEILANFSSNFTWYFGLDGNVPAGSHDFLSVALHEIGHGLGFTGSARRDNGVAPSECTGAANIGCLSDPPRAYDRFVQHGTVAVVGGIANNSLALGTALVSNNLFFAGPNATAANSGVRPALYAPSPWAQGSSFSHLGEVFNNTTSALMTYSLSSGESIHQPGPVGLGVLLDLGWRRAPTEVFVNRAYSGVELGTSANPYNTVLEGTQAVRSGGTVSIRTGSYNERLTIVSPMTLRPSGGLVMIGK